MNAEFRLFDVHLFGVMRRKVAGIFAATPEDAIDLALDSPAVSRWIQQHADADDSGEFAEEYSQFLVDVVGDEEFKQSRWFHCAHDPLLKPLRELVAWDESGRDPDIIQRLLAEIRQTLAQVV